MNKAGYLYFFACDFLGETRSIWDFMSGGPEYGFLFDDTSHDILGQINQIFIDFGFDHWLWDANIYIVEDIEYNFHISEQVADDYIKQKSLKLYEIKSTILTSQANLSSGVIVCYGYCLLMLQAMDEFENLMQDPILQNTEWDKRYNEYLPDFKTTITKLREYLASGAFNSLSTETQEKLFLEVGQLSGQFTSAVHNAANIDF